MNQDKRRTFSDDVLAVTPTRALKLLSYASRNNTARRALQQRGFSKEDLEAGWKLFFLSVGYPPADQQVETDPATATALAILDAWDEPNFQVFRAALSRLHPDVVEILFHDLEAGRGAASIVSITTFLDRVDHLEKKGEHLDALATLETRGLTQAKRQELRSLLEIAKGTQVVLEPVSDEDTEAVRREALVDLKLWYDDGAATARNSGLNRYHLINLGLATRKKAKGDPADPA